MGAQPSPSNGVWAVTSGGEQQYAPTQLVLMNPNALQTTGDSEGHPNMQPYLGLTYGIALGT
jgi:microcystin-dependent protein